MPLVISFHDLFSMHRLMMRPDFLEMKRESNP